MVVRVGASVSVELDWDDLYSVFCVPGQSREEDIVLAFANSAV
jgi:hypothetical protein